MLTLLMGLFSFTSYAQAIPILAKYSDRPTAGTESPHSGRGYSHTNISTNANADKSMLDASSNFLAYQCSIYQERSGYVSGNAYTVITNQVDSVGFKLTFQMWNGCQWENISSVSGTKDNAYYIEKTAYRFVTRNKYYRVTAEHYSTNSGVTYTEYSTSDYIYVN